MNRFQSANAKSFILWSSLLFWIATPAQAYLDPGTGSMVLQLILGGVAGAMVVLKLYWARLKGLFGFSSETAAASSKEIDEPHDK